MNKKLRNSGIDIIGDIPWGTHFCQFYQTKEDLIEIIIPYFKAGLENNELCLWIIPESLNAAYLKEELGRQIPDFGIYLEKRQIEIIPYTDFYLKERGFDPQETLNRLIEKIKQALDNGYEGLRLTEAAFLQKDSPDNFLDYEEKLNTILNKFAIVSLCTYSLEICSPIEILEVSAYHHFGLGKKTGKWKKIENLEQKNNTYFEQTKELQEAYNALSESEKRYRMLFTNMTEGFLLAEIICDKDGRPYDYRYLEINPAFELHTGMKREHLLGKSALEIFHSIPPIEIEEFGKVALSGGSTHFEVYAPPADTYYEIYSFNPKKGKFAVIFTDITERKKIEKELQESEVRFKSVLDNSIDIIYRLNVQTGYYEYISPSAKKIVDFSPSELMAMDVKTALSLLHPDDLPVMREALARLEENGEAEAIYRQRTKSGNYCWISNHMSLTRDSAGKPLYRTGNIHDITDLKKAEENLQKIYEEVQIQSEELQVANQELQAQAEELEQAYEAQRESEELFHKAFHANPAAMVLIDENERYIDVNKSFSELTGYTIGELIGHTSAELNIIEPEKRENSLIALREIDSFRNRERQIRTKSGEKKIVISNAELFDLNNKARYIGFIYDITRRKEAEQKLQESQARLLIAKEAADLGIHDYDISSGIIQWDKRVRDLWGVEPNELITYDTFMAGIHPEDRDVTQEAVNRALDPKGNGKYYAEYRVINRKDGIERWIATTGHVFFEYGAPVRLIGTVQDITERKGAEEALRESETKYRDIVETAQEGIWLIDADDRTVFVNQKLSEMLGYSAEEILGQSPQKFMAPEFQTAARDKLYEHRRGVNHVIDYRFIRKDGSDLWCILSSRALFDSKGKFAGSLSMLTDITGRKQNEEALRKSEERYRMLFTNMTEAFFLAEIICEDNGKPYDYRFLEINPALEHNIGVKRENLLGRSHLEVFHKVDPQVIEKYGEVALSGKPANFEFFSQVTNRYIDIHVFSPEKGKFAGIFRDITERKKIENDLRISEEHFRLALQNTPIVVANLDLDLRYTWIYNPRGGFSPQEILGQTVGMSSDPEIADRIAKSLRETLTAGIPFKWETFSKTKIGEDLFFESYAEPLRNAKGEITGIGLVAVDITERKKTEVKIQKLIESVQQEKEKLSALIQSIPDEVWFADAQKKITLVNPAALKGFGSSAFDNPDAETIARNSEVYRPDGIPHPVEEAPPLRALKGEIVRNQEEIVRIPATGEIHYRQVNAVPVKDASGNIIGSVSVVRDITELKQTEEALKKSHENLEEKIEDRTKELAESYNSLKESEKSLAEAQRIAHLGNWRHDLTTNKIYWSDEVYRIFGLEPQEFEITYNSFLSYVHPEDRDHINRVLNEVLNGHSYEIDYRIISAHGEERIVHSKGEVVFSEETVPIGTRGTIQDVTEQKRAEKERDQLLDAVQQEKDRLLALINSITDEVWFADTNENFVLVNYSVLDKFEISTKTEIDVEKFVGGQEVYLPDGSLRPIKESPVLRALQGDVIKNEEEIVRLPLNRELRYRQVNATPVRDTDGNIIGSVSVVRDITEQKKAEQALAKIEEARIKEIHHRIKNNLQVISSLLDLQSEKFTDAKVLEAFKESQNRVASMALIHEELYKGKGSENIDFAAYLHKLTLNLLDSYSVKNENVSLKLNIEQVYFNMDTAIPLGIIVNELVSNSLKHAFPNTRKGEICISLQKTRSSPDCKNSGHNEEFIHGGNFHYKLIVSDTGKGLPETIQLQSVNSLGLQLVDILVEQINGHVELKRNQGTQFTIWFNNMGK